MVLALKGMGHCTTHNTQTVNGQPGARKEACSHMCGLSRLQCRFLPFEHPRHTSTRRRRSYYSLALLGQHCVSKPAHTFAARHPIQCTRGAGKGRAATHTTTFLHFKQVECYSALVTDALLRPFEIPGAGSSWRPEGFNISSSQNVP